MKALSPTLQTPRRGWRIYCIALGALLALMYVVISIENFRPLLVLDFAITAVSFAALYGFAFHKRLASCGLWRAQCIIFPAWDVLFNFRFSNPPRGIESWIEVLVLFALLTPMYWSLWQYAYRSPIWDTRK